MKNLFKLVFAGVAALILAGCSTVKMPSEDIEVPEKFADIISVLRNPNLSPGSKEKYEAACELNKKVDLYFTRETITVNKLFYHRDVKVKYLGEKRPVYIFEYSYGNKSITFRFFAIELPEEAAQPITRVEIVEK